MNPTIATIIGYIVSILLGYGNGIGLGLLGFHLSDITNGNTFLFWSGILAIITLFLMLAYNVIGELHDRDVPGVAIPQLITQVMFTTVGIGAAWIMS